VRLMSASNRFLAVNVQYFKMYVMLRLFVFILIVALSLNCNNSRVENENILPAGSITKLEMNLSAFGVEADDFPSIAVYIDVVKDSSNCIKTYYNPKYKSSTYRLSSTEIQKIVQLLGEVDLKKLKSEYSVSKTDQPASTTTIYTGEKIFIIKDYGLEGEFPLQELYKIVYKI
jgi:hypothetical protein